MALYGSRSPNVAGYKHHIPPASIPVPSSGHILSLAVERSVSKVADGKR